MSLLGLLCVCDGGDGSLALADIADTSPPTVHRLLPQRHLRNKHIHSRQIVYLVIVSSVFENENTETFSDASILRSK